MSNQNKQSGWIAMMTFATLFSPAAIADEQDALGAKKRADVPAKHQWNLGEIFPSTDAFEAAFKNVDALIAKTPAFKGTLAASPEKLLAALKLHDETLAELDRVIVFAGMSHHENMSISQNQGRFDRAQSLATKAGEAFSWLVPEILAIPDADVDQWMTETKSLAVYRHYFDDLRRQRPHTLTPREEELLAMAGDISATPNNVFSIYTNTELDFPKITDEKDRTIKLTNALYSQLIYSKDRRVRRDAFLGLHKTYLSKKNTLAAALSGQVKQHIFHAKARKYSSSLEAALDGPGIPTNVYTNLVETVAKHTPKLHRYVALKKKLLNLPDIRGYDLYVPMIDVPEEKIPYDAAVETILTALQPLGDEYTGTLRQAFESRWIDVYETENKRSGAYCWGAYLTHPYLLLNYHGTMNDRSTVAHEMGHAMHSFFTHQTQPFIYGDYATFCAEVASTVNEVILAHHLLSAAENDAQRLLILQQQIEGIRTTVFRQTMFAEFEKTIHDMAESSQPLTGDVLTKTYTELVRKYYGPELIMEDCDGAEGLRIPHFYSNFYVYTYATSHCAATNIGRRIIKNDPGAVEGLRSFLSAGSSDEPLDILKLAGVDMTTPQPIEDTMTLFDELLTQFETLHDKYQKSSQHARR